MTLEKYKQKRNASVTPEPFGGKNKEKGKLHFVIQKHAASHLHYDFRLEMEGVLKSWAVPKGPSIDPDVKRLAMMVEDHPYDYRNFEGIIPKGEYGGGTVIVWDEGTYEPADYEKKTKNDPDRNMEKYLLDGLRMGKLHFVLHGQKLKGEFALIKAPGRGENAWLLMKLKDEFAAKRDITLEDKSVQSGETLEIVRDTSTNIYGQVQEDAGEKVKKELNTGADNKGSGNTLEILEKAPSTSIPSGIKPMLATLVDEPFDSPDWFYEIKWDGYRALGYIENGNAQLISRNNKSFSDKYYPITEALKQWKINAVIDGELVVLKENGISDFNALQNWRSEADGELMMYVFDLLWYEGKNLMSLPLKDRQAVLKEILPTNDDRIRLSQVFQVNGIEFFQAAEKLGLEGIMAKKSSSRYSSDNRSREWLKIKANKRQEVVIGGYTLNEGTGKKFSSLLLGVYDHGKLQYIGKVGTGFNDKIQDEMMELFQPLIISESPFQTEPDVNEPSRFRPNPPKAKATWLKPELVCEVSFTEFTNDRVLRHPSFKGLRTDKKATEVIREKEIPVEKVVEPEKTKNTMEKKQEKSKPVSPLVKEPEKKAKGALLNPTEETQVKKINGHDLKFTSLSKVYWPEDGFTKRDMFNYYYQVAEYIVPHLKDRPQSLNRFPNGIHGKSFYQKDVKGKAPDWALTFPYVNDGEDKEFLVGTDEATLLWMASLGCIEMNPWFSRIQSPENPDYCVIDLDPDKNTFDQVIEVALEVKKILDMLRVRSYPKTSGSTGMHIYIPLGARYSYDQSQMFARIVVNIVHHHLPEFTTIERMVSNRNGKMYLDFLQNRPGATIASVYSLRPKPGATVSMPLHWEEVKKGLTMKDFTIRNAIARLKNEGDIFRDVLGEGIDIGSVLESASALA